MRHQQARAVADPDDPVRWAARFTWSRPNRPGAGVTPAQIDELTRLVDEAAPALGPETTLMLHDWLTKPPG